MTGISNNGPEFSWRHSLSGLGTKRFNYHTTLKHKPSSSCDNRGKNSNNTSPSLILGQVWTPQTGFFANDFKSSLNTRVVHQQVHQPQLTNNKQSTGQQDTRPLKHKRTTSTQRQSNKVYLYTIIDLHIAPTITQVAPCK